MIHPAAAEQKIPQLFAGMADELPISPFFKYLYQLEQINEPVYHTVSVFVKIKKNESSFKIR